MVLRSTRPSGLGRGCPREYPRGGHNQRQLWTNEDINKVLAKEKPDKELAKELGRSIEAIRYCRYLYRTRPGLSEKELAKRNTTPIKEYEEHAVNQLG